jgi:hypothetical protein
VVRAPRASGVSSSRLRLHRDRLSVLRMQRRAAHTAGGSPCCHRRKNRRVAPRLPIAPRTLRTRTMPVPSRPALAKKEGMTSCWHRPRPPNPHHHQPQRPAGQGPEPAGGGRETERTRGKSNRGLERRGFAEGPRHGTDGTARRRGRSGGRRGGGNERGSRRGVGGHEGDPCSRHRGSPLDPFSIPRRTISTNCTEAVLWNSTPNLGGMCHLCFFDQLLLEHLVGGEGFFHKRRTSSLLGVGINSE